MKDKARLEWLEEVAYLERSDLIKRLETAEEAAVQARHAASNALQDAKRLKVEVSKLKNEREGKKIIVARSFQSARFAIRRLGLNPNRTTIIAADDLTCFNNVRGLSVDPEHVYFVRGWKRGRYVREVEQSLAPSLRRADGTPVGLDCIAYAPDPHFDMHEDDGWRGATAYLEEQLGNTTMSIQGSV